MQTWEVAGTALRDVLPSGGRGDRYGRRMTTSTPAPPRSVDLRAVAASVVVLVASCAAIWFLAVPVPAGQVCPAIYPAPPYCTLDGRQESGAVAMMVMIALYLVVCAVVILAPQRRVRRTAVLLLAVAGCVAFLAVR